MCLLLLAFRAHPELPLLVAANRDERLGRPTGPMGPWPGRPELLGQRDEEGGGSWLIARRDGFFAAVTNHRPAGAPPPAPGARSRGELPLRLAETEGWPERLRWLQGLKPETFAPFQLVAADAERALLAVGRPGEARLRWRWLPPGVHALANDEPGSPRFPKARWLAEQAEALLAERPPWPRLAEGLGALMRSHRPHPPPAAVAAESPFPPEARRALAAPCVHLPGYGTRASALLAAEPGRLRHLLLADGPPCRAPYTPVV